MSELVENENFADVEQVVPHMLSVAPSNDDSMSMAPVDDLMSPVSPDGPETEYSRPTGSEMDNLSVAPSIGPQSSVGEAIVEHKRVSIVMMDASGLPGLNTIQSIDDFSDDEEPTTATWVTSPVNKTHTPTSTLTLNTSTTSTTSAAVPVPEPSPTAMVPMPRVNKNVFGKRREEVEKFFELPKQILASFNKETDGSYLNVFDVYGVERYRTGPHPNDILNPLPPTTTTGSVSAMASPRAGQGMLELQRVSSSNPAQATNTNTNGNGSGSGSGADSRLMSVLSPRHRSTIGTLPTTSLSAAEHDTTGSGQARQPSQTAQNSVYSGNSSYTSSHAPTPAQIASAYAAAKEAKEAREAKEANKRKHPTLSVPTGGTSSMATPITLSAGSALAKSKKAQGSAIVAEVQAREQQYRQIEGEIYPYSILTGVERESTPIPWWSAMESKEQVIHSAEERPQLFNEYIFVHLRCTNLLNIKRIGQVFKPFICLQRERQVRDGPSVWDTVATTETHSLMMLGRLQLEEQRRELARFLQVPAEHISNSMLETSPCFPPLLIPISVLMEGEADRYMRILVQHQDDIKSRTCGAALLSVGKLREHAYNVFLPRGKQGRHRANALFMREEDYIMQPLVNTRMGLDEAAEKGHQVAKVYLSMRQPMYDVTTAATLTPLTKPMPLVLKRSYVSLSISTTGAVDGLKNSGKKRLLSAAYLVFRSFCKETVHSREFDDFSEADIKELQDLHHNAIKGPGGCSVVTNHDKKSRRAQAHGEKASYQQVSVYATTVRHTTGVMSWNFVVPVAVLTGGFCDFDQQIKISIIDALSQTEGSKETAFTVTTLREMLLQGTHPWVLYRREYNIGNRAICTPISTLFRTANSAQSEKNSSANITALMNERALEFASGADQQKMKQDRIVARRTSLEPLSPIAPKPATVPINLGRRRSFDVNVLASAAAAAAAATAAAAQGPTSPKAGQSAGGATSPTAGAGAGAGAGGDTRADVNTSGIEMGALGRQGSETASLRRHNSTESVGQSSATLRRTPTDAESLAGAPALSAAPSTSVARTEAVPTEAENGLVKSVAGAPVPHVSMSALNLRINVDCNTPQKPARQGRGRGEGKEHDERDDKSDGNRSVRQRSRSRSRARQEKQTTLPHPVNGYLFTSRCTATMEDLLKQKKIDLKDRTMRLTRCGALVVENIQLFASAADIELAAQKHIELSQRAMRECCRISQNGIPALANQSEGNTSTTVLSPAPSSLSTSASASASTSTSHALITSDQGTLLASETITITDHACRWWSLEDNICPLHSLSKPKRAMGGSGANRNGKMGDIEKRSALEVYKAMRDLKNNAMTSANVLPPLAHAFLAYICASARRTVPRLMYTGSSHADFYDGPHEVTPGSGKMNGIASIPNNFSGSSATSANSGTSAAVVSGIVMNGAHRIGGNVTMNPGVYTKAGVNADQMMGPEEGEGHGLQLRTEEELEGEDQSFVVMNKSADDWMLSRKYEQYHTWHMNCVDVDDKGLYQLEVYVWRAGQYELFKISPQVEAKKNGAIWCCQFPPMVLKGLGLVQNEKSLKIPSKIPDIPEDPRVISVLRKRVKLRYIRKAALLRQGEDVRALDPETVPCEELVHRIRVALSMNQPLPQWREDMLDDPIEEEGDVSDDEIENDQFSKLSAQEQACYATGEHRYASYNRIMFAVAKVPKQMFASKRKIVQFGSGYVGELGPIDSDKHAVQLDLPLVIFPKHRHNEYEYNTNNNTGKSFGLALSGRKFTDPFTEDIWYDHKCGRPAVVLSVNRRPVRMHNSVVHVGMTEVLFEDVREEVGVQRKKKVEEVQKNKRLMMSDLASNEILDKRNKQWKKKKEEYMFNNIVTHEKIDINKQDLVAVALPLATQDIKRAKLSSAALEIKNIMLSTHNEVLAEKELEKAARATRRYFKALKKQDAEMMKEDEELQGEEIYYA